MEHVLPRIEDVTGREVIAGAGRCVYVVVVLAVKALEGTAGGGMNVDPWKILGGGEFEATRRWIDGGGGLRVT